MDKKQMALGIGGVALLIWILSRKSQPVAVAQQYGDFVAPGNIPGFAGNTFISNVEVSANPQLLGALDNKYIPLFGFVGSVAFGYPVEVEAAPVEKPRQCGVMKTYITNTDASNSLKQGASNIYFDNSRGSYYRAIDTCVTGSSSGGGGSSGNRNGTSGFISGSTNTTSSFSSLRGY